MKRWSLFLALLIGLSIPAQSSAERLLVQMDLEQRDHLRAYGLAFWSLERGVPVDWLLNYRGGSFLMDDSQDIRDQATLVGVSYKVIDAATANSIYKELQGINAGVVLLEKSPKIAVYVTPGN